ncbi:branched-chain amino acid transport system permease protein [Ilumatobacter fluminis]|uniref:Branched-chain amino acid transport system permease protein n=1 Tax=Ilumatobacter fluminis TaxID=467091 RepID=A0A4R7I6T8_9ACTN|nr:branched-chain amino acid ABC transporter permease [Ilumatobacter fluminis]TDT18523.1 branched-chain amino acid transport system permease protein [Ilumatobacter fluminis]
MATKYILAGTSQHKIWKYGTWGLFILLVILVAFAYVDTGFIEIGGNKYNISMIRLSKAVAFAVAILGLQCVVGFTGQVALGQSFFVGSGAYLTAWLVADHQWPYLLTLVVVIPACFLIGMILGLPALRIKGLYLALVTLGMAAVFPSIVKLDSLSDKTGGSGGKSTAESKLEAPDWAASIFDGIAGALQQIPFFGQYFGEGDLSSREADRMWKFLIFSIVAAICFWLVNNLVKSRPGRAMRAIRDNETGAAVSGVDLAMTKTLAFGVSSALGGVAGTLYVMEVGIASPDDFTQLLAINLIVGLVVGGVGTLSGAVVGGLVVVLIPDWAASTESAAFVPQRWLQGPTGGFLLGLMLIILTFVLPGGIVAGFRKLRARFVQVVPRPPDGSVPAAFAAATAGATTAGEAMLSSESDDELVHSGPSDGGSTDE